MKSDIASRVQFYNGLDTSKETVASAGSSLRSKGSSLSGSLTSLLKNEGSSSSSTHHDGGSALSEALQKAVFKASLPSTRTMMTEVKESMPAAPPAAAAAVVGAPSVTSIAASKFGAGAFGGGANKCATCTKTVYAMEQLTYDGKMFHKNCLKCAHCNCVINLKNVASLEGEYYCKPHFKQLFKLKGNYAEGFGKEDHKKQWSQSSQSSQA